MAKTERVLQLMALLRSEGRVTLRELSRRFGVSERTVYRDLKALSRLDCPVRCEQGSYVLASAQDAEPPDSEDIVLLGYCLEYTPLRQYPVFARRLKKLQEIACRQGSHRHPRSRKSRILRYKPASLKPQSARKEQDLLLRRFVQACRESLPVTIKTNSRHLPSGFFRPVGVLLTASGPVLQIDLNDKQVGIPLNAVADLRLCKDHANRPTGANNREHSN